MRSVDGGVLFLIMLATVLMAGCMAAMQRGLFAVNWQARDGVRDRVADAERRRVAGEIQVVVAQSFSVMLLHLSEARRVLQHDEDTDAAVRALLDAERLGRRAMADIRRAVRRLDLGQIETTAESNVGDIADHIVCRPSA